MSYLTQIWETESLLGGLVNYRILKCDDFAILYDDSLHGFDGIVTAFSDEVLDMMGVLEGDWRREFDEIYDEGYEAAFFLFRELYSEYGIGMILV